MKYTLSDCIESINQILNYPSVSYVDISHFFDHAISEINSELRLGLKPISDIYKKSGFKLESLKHFVVFNSRPVVDIPTEADKTDADIVWYDTEDKLIHYKKGNSILTTNKLYGIYAFFEEGKSVREIYQTLVLGGRAYWSPYEHVPERDVNLLDYLTYDWVVLFLIPYVCFKYAVRDGDSGALYSDEFQQGFQQLRNSYNIPNFVNLQEQAGKKAYLEDIQARLPKLDIIIPTRAIYEDMKIPSVILPEHGGIFDNGGWGV